MTQLQIDESLLLGLDIGTNSVGWALIRLKGEEPTQIVDLGTRVFPEGMDISNGKAVSRNEDRRGARLRRRQLARRRQRLEGVIVCLQEMHLLPEGNRAAAGTTEPGTLASAFLQFNDKESPYALRARGLVERLEPHELGRAFFHLARRRGFLSNRREAATEDQKERSSVLSELSHHEVAMKDAGAPTWGAYLAMEEQKGNFPLRKKRTQRSWFQEEFGRLWAAQSHHYPEILTRTRRAALHHAMFFQRPLKTPKSSIGKCTLEESRTRAPVALLDAQRARLLQDVNHLRLILPGRVQSRALTPEERQKIVEKLSGTEKVKLVDLREQIDAPKRSKFNLELGDRDSIPGDTTSTRLMAVFGESWWDLPQERGKPNLMPPTIAELRQLQNAVVEDVLTYTSKEGLKKRGVSRWGLSPEKAEAFSLVSLDEGYSSLSRRALQRILPYLEQGKSYTEAVLAAGYQVKGAQCLDQLPAVPDLRNPIVRRSLTEVRKVVNHLVLKYGKPGTVRIELARDLKRSTKQREIVFKRQRQHEREREMAAKHLKEDFGLREPIRPWQIEKYLLWKECNCTCPYTGKQIPAHRLFGPEIEVEHIIPMVRSFDNSFLNKTLCYAEVNQTKGKRTPWEAFGASPEWQHIVRRVEQFGSGAVKGRGARTSFGKSSNSPKLDRFELRDVADGDAFLESFTNSQLTNTAYATTKAVELVSSLYGDSWRQHVQTSVGQITSWLSSSWDLHSLLAQLVRDNFPSSGHDEGQVPVKLRVDHRHHALDAVVTALASPKLVKQLSLLASRPEYVGRRRIELPAPWPTFREELLTRLKESIVSHRVSRKDNGALHKETIYGWIHDRDAQGRKIFEKNGAPRYCAVLRKPVHSVSTSEVQQNAIVDERVRTAVHQRIAELAGLKSPSGLSLASSKAVIETALKQLEAQPSLYPTLELGDGQTRVIKRVRVWQDQKPVLVGEGARARMVDLRANHHLAIFEHVGKTGKTEWRSEVVSRFEAMNRRRSECSVYRSKDSNGNACVLTLRIGETVELDVRGECGVYVVQKLSDGDVQFRRHNDARPAGDSKSDGVRIRSDSQLKMALKAKFKVTPIGELLTVWKSERAELEGR